MRGECERVRLENEEYRRESTGLRERLKSVQSQLESMTHSYEMEKERRCDKEKEVEVVLIEKEEVVKKYQELRKEVEDLRHERDAEVRFVEVLEKQRDTMGEVVEESQREVVELREVNRTLRGQKDELKEELILVLETLSQYQ